MIIFFDRDGVLTPSIEVNGVPTPTYKVGDNLNSKVRTEIISLKKMFTAKMFMVTNQPDIARKKNY